MKKKSKHDSLEDIVEQQVKKDYLFIAKNVDYRDENGQIIGEIDLIGVSMYRVDLYEMKSTDKEKNKEKALKQLERAKKYFQGAFPQPINCFYMTYGSNGDAVCLAVIPAGNKRYKNDR